MFGVVPVVGKDLVQWLWGGPAVGDNTLKRFYVFHFTIPYVLLVVIVIHVVALHETGSRNVLNIDAGRVGEVSRFGTLYLSQDVLGFVVLIFVLFNLCT